MKKEITTKREIPEFTLEQKAYLESFFTSLSDTLESIQATLKVTNESIIDSTGEQNKNITVWDIHKSLSLVNDSLDPINIELFEISTGANYLFWNTDKKNNPQFWDKVEKSYPNVLENAKRYERLKKVTA